MIISRLCLHSGPVNNVMIARQPQMLNPRTSASAASSRRHALTLPPPLEKFANAPDENTHVKAFVGGQASSNEISNTSYVSIRAMEAQIRELQVCILWLPLSYHGLNFSWSFLAAQFYFPLLDNNLHLIWSNYSAAKGIKCSCWSGCGTTEKRPTTFFANDPTLENNVR